MSVGNITTNAVDRMLPGFGNIFLWDQALAGFGVRVTQNGTKSYIYQYRLGDAVLSLDDLRSADTVRHRPLKQPVKKPFTSQSRSPRGGIRF